MENYEEWNAELLKTEWRGLPHKLDYDICGGLSALTQSVSKWENN